MRRILIELHIPDKEEGDLFILEHPTYGDTNFYRQAVSYSHFRERELTKAFPDVSSGKSINGMNWVQYAKTVRYCSELHNELHHVGYISRYLNLINVDINTVPVCKDVWDFYAKIGYDRKKKKYI